MSNEIVLDRQANERLVGRRGERLDGLNQLEAAQPTDGLKVVRLHARVEQREHAAPRLLEVRMRVGD